MTTPAAPWHRPYLSCRRPPEAGGQTLPVPAPGTIVQTADGATNLFVGDVWPIEGLDVDQLALRLRHARRIFVVGDMWQAARPAKHAINASWSRANQARRDAAKAALPPKPPTIRRPRCGQPRVDGLPCRAIAGAGTDTLGTGPCASHGGSTALQDQAVQDLHDRVRRFAALRRKSVTQPLTLQEQLDSLTALREILTAPEPVRRRASRTPSKPPR